MEELASEPAEEGGVKDGGVGGRRIEAHLRVGEMKDKVLALVADVVGLEAEEEAEPVEEVVDAVEPGVKGGFPEVGDITQGGSGGSDLGRAVGGVID